MKSCANAAQLYGDFLQNSSKPPTLRFVAGVEDSLKTTAPFPNIFSPCVTDDGYIDTCHKSSAPGKNFIGFFILQYNNGNNDNSS